MSDLQAGGLMKELHLVKPEPDPNARRTRETSPSQVASAHDPVLDITRLREQISKWLWIPDEDADIIDFCLAVYKSNELPGDPLWGMFIDASGSGKTELLRAFRPLPSSYFLSNMTENSLISGYRDPNRPDSDPSLLPALDEKVLIIKDLAPLLSMRRESRDAVFAQLRDAYDGFTDQGRGNIGRVSYTSRFSLLAAATLAIERYDTVDQELGERFIKIRARGDADRAKVRRAIANIGSDGSMRAEIETAVASFLNPLPKMENTPIPDHLIETLTDLADFTAKARSHVPRNRNHEIQYTPRPEVGTRVGRELAKLLLALAAVHGKDEPGESEMEIVRRVAEDCLPPNRLEVTEIIRSSEKPLTSADIEDSCNLSPSTARRTIQDLTVLGALESFTSKGNTFFRLSSE